MNQRGNCHDNAVAERFFYLLKRERIGRTYKDKEDVRHDVFPSRQLLSIRLPGGGLHRNIL